MQIPTVTAAVALITRVFDWVRAVRSLVAPARAVHRASRTRLEIGRGWLLLELNSIESPEVRGAPPLSPPATRDEKGDA